MKFLTSIPYLIISLLIAACNRQQKPVVEEQKITKTEDLSKINDYKLDTLKGIYIGPFGGSPITIVLTYLNENKAIGYNVHQGLQRNLVGSVKMKENEVEFVLEEPGDNPYDGIFTFSIDKKSFKLRGKWESISGKISTKSYLLSKNRRENEDSKFYMDVEQKITRQNLSDYFGFCRSINDELEFKDDGIVLYNHYPILNGKVSQQFEQIKGNWTLERGDVIEISWQENKVFPSRKSRYLINKNEEYGYYILKGDTSIFEPNFY